ncbi:hypothetical protein [Reyranella sp.]|uniref:hypothetical protein n=1 Tax=Reyranella sp. TaxID=1929291 RepID=UPI0040367BC6
MPDISGDLFKVGLDDARARHAAVVNLILFTDTQALGLLRLYIPLGIATASGAVASFSVNPSIPKVVGVALGAATVCLILAAWLCFRAMATSKINLQGRGAEFWEWAANQSAGEVFRSYMRNLREKQVNNNDLNARTARMLRFAKICAIASPAVAAVAGGAAVWAGL